MGTRPGNNSKGKTTTIAGLTEYLAKRLCKFVFADYFISIEKDDKNIRYNVKIRNEVEYEGEMIKFEEDSLQDFIEFWGPKFWKVIRVKEVIEEEIN